MAPSQGGDEEAGEVSRGHSWLPDRPKGRTEEAERNLFLRERSSARKRVETLKVDLRAGRRKRTETRVNGANVPAGEAQSNPENHPRMEAVVERQNLLRALAAVEGNQVRLQLFVLAYNLGNLLWQA